MFLGDESETTPPAEAGHTPPEQPPVENETTTTPKLPRDNRPDVGNLGSHLAVQGIVTFRQGLMEYVLAPWQMLPFSQGYEFLGAAHSLLYHRGVYKVDMHGHPESASKQRGPLAFAAGAYGYVTPADSIVGFSGLKYRKSSVTMETALRMRDNYTKVNSQEQPWSISPENLVVPLDEILPQFWVEMEDPCHPYTPFEYLFDVTTGKKVRVVRLEHWHLLAPVPGVSKEWVEACCQEHGWRFLLNRIYISGAGLRPTQQDKSEALYTMHGVGFPTTHVKLKTVLLPCVNYPMGKTDGGKTDGGIHDLFSSPSAPALRNLLGDQVIPGNSVFA